MTGTDRSHPLFAVAVTRILRARRGGARLNLHARVRAPSMHGYSRLLCGILWILWPVQRIHLINSFRVSERLGRPVIPLSRRFRVDEMTDLHEVSDIARASIHRKVELAWSVWRLVTRRVSRSVSISALDVIGRPRCRDVIALHIRRKWPRT